MRWFGNHELESTMSLSQVNDSGRRFLRIMEWTAVGLAAAWLARLAYLNGGFITGSDMPYYLDIGLRGAAEPFIVNRYTHVYALRLASILVGNTLGGMRLYSGIVAGLTILLTYFSARHLTKESTLPNGLIATLLLLSLPLSVTLVLAPSVDTTLMVIVLAFIALYVQFTREGHSGPWLVVGLGVLFILAVRTKEAAWVLLAFVPGLGLAGEGNFEWSTLRYNMRFFFLGAAVGILFMIVANSVFLGTPLFGLRPSDIATHFSIWSDLISSKPKAASTINELVIGDDGLVFVLFAIGGLWHGRSIPKATRLIWLFPLLLIGFLLVGTTRTAWTIVPRGFLSGLAVMSLLASHVFAVRLPMHRRSIQTTLAAGAIAAGFALFGYVTKNDLPYATYFELALAPILLGSVLAIMIFSQHREYSGWAAFVLLLALTGFSAKLNLSAVVSDLEDSGWRSRFALPLSLRDNIDPASPFDAYVSWSALTGLRGVANPDELAGIFNVVLDSQTLSADYEIGTVGEPLILSMERAGHKYVVISTSEWDWLRTAPQDRPEWRALYYAFEEPGGRYVLLTLKEESNSG